MHPLGYAHMWRLGLRILPAEGLEVHAHEPESLQSFQERLRVSNVCTYIHTQTCIHTHMYICIYIYIYTCTYICVCNIYMSKSIYLIVYLSICLPTPIYLYAYLCMCMYAYIYVYTTIYIYVYFSHSHHNSVIAFQPERRGWLGWG